MPYYGYGYYGGYGDCLANNIYVLLLIPVLLFAFWAQMQLLGRPPRTISSGLSPAAPFRL